MLRSLIFFLTLCLSSLGLIFSQNDYELNQAASLEASGDWEGAVSIYKDYIKRNPSEQAYLMLFNTLKNNGEYKDAENYIKDAIEQFPKRVEFCVELFLLYEQWGNEKKAEKYFNKILKNLKANHSDIVRLGNAFLSARRFENAKQIYLKGRELLGDKTAYGFQLGSIFLQEGDYESIAKEYLFMLESDSRNLPQIEANLAALFARDSSDLIQTVETQWQQLYRKHKTNPYFSQFGLWLYTQSNQFDKALEMAKYIDKTFESNSGGGMSDFAENMANAGQISTARRAYKYVLDKGEECVFYQRSLIGYANVMYESFIQTPDKGERLEELKKLFSLVFEKCGYGKECFETILSAAEVLAFYDSQAEQAVELLERCIKTPGFSINEKAEMKLLSAEIYNRFGDSWQASLLCSQVEKDCKNSPLADRAKFFKAMLSYYNGEIEWALSQFKSLRASTTKLISNDAMEYSVLIAENRDDDSTFSAMQWFAAAERERNYSNFEAAYQYLDSIEHGYLYHPLFDECIYLKALLAKDKGEIDVADSLFKSLLLKYPYDLTADDAIMQLAEIAEKHYHDLKAAKEYYQKLILDYPTSLYVTQARKQHRRLENY